MSLQLVGVIQYSGIINKTKDELRDPFMGSESYGTTVNKKQKQKN